MSFSRFLGFHLILGVDYSAFRYDQNDRPENTGQFFEASFVLPMFLSAFP
jgi:hypothetical protein